jgi:hypothetical protein
MRNGYIRDLRRCPLFGRYQGERGRDADIELLLALPKADIRRKISVSMEPYKSLVWNRTQVFSPEPYKSIDMEPE